MSNAGAVFRATDQQKHGAQSEVFQRMVNPVGFVSRAVPTTFNNENRFTAAHASNPVGNPPKRAGSHIGKLTNGNKSVRVGAHEGKPIADIQPRALPRTQHLPGVGH